MDEPAYRSKFYSCEQIDQRLLQGYYDDFVETTGYSGTKEDFLNDILTSINVSQDRVYTTLPNSVGVHNFPRWISNHEYQKGHVIVYEYLLFQALTDHTSGNNFSEDNSLWEEVSISELIISLTGLIKNFEVSLENERKERIEQDSLLWGGIKNEANIRTAEDEKIHKRIEGIQGDIKILDKIKEAVEEWPTEKVEHTIQFGDTPSVVAVGDTIKWPKETVEWNPRIEKYNEEDTIDYEKHLECANGDEVEWNGQTSWSASELGKNTFYLTYSYPVGEYTIESNLGSKKTVIVPPVNGGQIKKEVQVTYPWYINDTPQTKLIPIGATETTTVTLSGSPKIKIPFANSQIDVKAEVMAGQYMPVSAWKTGEETINGVTYKTYYKEDSYSTPVSHKITITIKR